MKNIYILPTDKPSKLYYNTKGKNYAFSNTILSQGGCVENQHIYITSDEKIKEDDSVISTFNRWENSGNLLPVIGKIKQIQKDDYLIEYYNIYLGEKSSIWEFGHSKKIILTTDQDLIKDGVQAIDDEFLEWFVKNPNCEEVKIDKIIWNGVNDFEYKIIIPKEEVLLQSSIDGEAIWGEARKQETLEEAAEKWVFETNGHKWSNNDDTAGDNYGSFMAGSKWRGEQMCNHNYILTDEQGHRVIKCDKCNHTQPI